MRIHVRFTVLLGLAALVFLAPWGVPRPLPAAPDDAVIVGVIQDGPSPVLDAFAAEIEVQTRALLGDIREVLFQPVEVESGWNPASLREALNKALSSPQIQVVLGVGLLIEQICEDPTLSFAKPVVTAYLERSELSDLPVTEDGYSAKPNYIFSVVNLPVTRDIRAFRELIPFQTLTVLVDSQIVKNVPELDQVVAKLEESEKIKLKLIPVGSSASEALARIPGGTQAIFIANLLQLDAEQYSKLIAGINRKGIPSFSILGHPDVHKGVLAGLTPDLIQQTARQSAINLQQAIMGRPLKDLPVFMPVEASLLINAKTARQVRFHPSLMTLQTVHFLHPEILSYGEPLTVDQAMKTGAARNIDLSIAQARIRLSEQDSKIARSPLLPQAAGSIRYNQIDRDRAIASLGTVPQRETTGNVGLSQIIFNDPILSDFRSSRREIKRSRYERTSIRLDAMQSSGVRFAEVLAAKALLAIEWENLDLTRNLLEIARLRYEVGSGGRDQVYRWEAQENQQRGDVFVRYADLQRALVALNQSLNVDQLKQWKPRDISFEEVKGYFFEKRLTPIITDTKHLKDMQVFVADEAIKNAPELKAINAQAEARGITLGQKKRRFFVPDAQGDFLYTNELQADRPGALSPTQAHENRWQLGVSLSLPLFEGGRRFHEIGQVKAELMRLDSEMIRIQQILEQQSLSALYAVQSSYFNLGFSKKAAESAKLNFDIVELKYTQGLVGIIDMLDAQNEYIRRSQESALAVYQYLIDMINLQRAIAWFAVDKTEQDKRVWVQNLAHFLGVKP